MICWRPPLFFYHARRPVIHSYIRKLRVSQEVGLIQWALELEMILKVSSVRILNVKEWAKFSGIQKISTKFSGFISKGILSKNFGTQGTIIKMQQRTYIRGNDTSIKHSRCLRLLCVLVALWLQIQQTYMSSTSIVSESAYEPDELCNSARLPNLISKSFHKLLGSLRALPKLSKRQKTFGTM